MPTTMTPAIMSPGEAEDELAALLEVLRTDFTAFFEQTFLTVAPGDVYQPNWHLDAMAYRLEQCRSGQVLRLIVTVPPRSGKSIMVSIAFVAWLLGHDPTLEIMCVSYGRELSAKFHRDTRAVLSSDWYRVAFPGTRISPEKDTEHELTTTRRGGRIATSLDGVVTGRGCDVMIVDDPQKAHDAMSKTERARVTEIFSTTLSTRLNDKNTGVIIVVAQRLHVDDLVGHLSEQGGWTHLSLPAITEQEQEVRLSDRRSLVRPVGHLLHPERESEARLMEAKQLMGSLQFSAQYLQNPIPEAGNLVKWEWFRTYKELPARASGDQIVLSIDTASKAGELNDYTACSVWLIKGGLRTGNLYLVHMYRFRLLFPDLKRRIEAIAQAHAPTGTIIEDSASGTSLIQEFQRGTKIRPIAFRPTEDKVTRMSHQAIKIENGRVFIPEQAPWLAEFKAEILAFPEGKHDDQVDGVSQFLAWLDQHREYFVGTMPIKGMR